MSETFSNLVNWENLNKHKDTFQTQKPFNFVFIENFFTQEFYDSLYRTYPKIDETWGVNSDHSKSQYYKTWNNKSTNTPSTIGDDTTLGDSWNKLKRYAESNEFIENFNKFSNIPVKKMKYILFMGYKKGGFQLPHIHNVGPSTLVLMFYFSKNWKNNSPGGTYMAKEEDESSIIFEPYNLDNSMAMFLDGPNAAHGVRYITDDVVRQGFQITLEGVLDDGTWSGEN